MTLSEFEATLNVRKMCWGDTKLLGFSDNKGSFLHFMHNVIMAIRRVSCVLLCQALSAKCRDIENIILEVDISLSKLLMLTQQPTVCCSLSELWEIESVEGKQGAGWFHTDIDPLTVLFLNRPPATFSQGGYRSDIRRREG